ncbi:MAG: 23S rRNA (adenine(2503)-C(2))-methyltransferase RlmN [Endomicrobium sp.]|jgi:23S rRNA (adenine2503-C2)-methyltransferase|nr:23S rRNA (adenine(2503)-C(2))-methyltransferase RlmN [Endomicrobium sp.]
MKKYILDLTITQLKNILKTKVSQEYVFSQILDWIYVKKVISFKDFTNISKKLKEKLDEIFILRTLKIIKKEQSKIDGTTRYIFQTSDKKYFFAVLLSSKEKNSICISSQIGCPVMCSFCSSGKVKYIRNLTKGEILEQILQIENDTKKRISRVLFMGMGEPTLNINNVTLVLNSLLSNKEFGIGKKHITLSSVGNVPVIKKLADSRFGVRIALSLHATDEKQRRKLIPNNFGFSINDILDAGKYYLKKTNSRLTIEYILVKDINDSIASAHKLARLLKHHELINSNMQVNLIPFNFINNTQFKTSKSESIQKFKNMLKLNKIIVNIRQAKGIDIKAACGQLGY